MENLLVAAGANVIEGNGSRVKFEKDGTVASFHRPHPDKEVPRTKRDRPLSLVWFIGFVL
ncbi:type II toxin-antitoxin system HicA family toxin (plasmid) [Ensifer adhaerens]|uniref:type II toxin-antitoxin system HicA family toxin n=1 Tax=Ensifer adhaerens TaxID=106592 RepID=UPI001CF0894E|nr:type II toxin-antitoxin system HicA family toxin [Ensifer adhaerens]